MREMAHANPQGPGQPALSGPGPGVLNYFQYIHLLHEAGYDRPSVIEHMAEVELREAMVFASSKLSVLPT